MHGPDYITLPSVDPFQEKHHEVTNATNMEDKSSQNRVLWCNTKMISIDGKHANWTATMLMSSAKATLTFPTKEWWAVVREKLRRTENDL